MALALFGKEGGTGTNRESVILVAVIVLFAVALAAFFYQQRSSNRNAQIKTEIVTLLDTTRALIAKTSDVAAAKPAAFQEIATLAGTLEKTAKTVVEGDPANDLPAAPSYAAAQANAVLDQSHKVKLQIQTFDDLKAARDHVTEGLKTLDATLPAVQDGYRQIAERLATRNAPAAQIYLAASQLIRLDHMSTDLRRELSLGEDISASGEKLGEDSKTFLRLNQDLLDANSSDAQTEGLLRKAALTYAPAADAITQIATDTPAAAKMLGTARKVSEIDGPALNKAITALGDELGSGLLGKLPYVIFGAGALAVALLMFYFALTLSAARERQKLAERRDAQQQTAILNLLDQIAGLADGDLTVSVPVTQEFTGALADSINYTVQTLRTLVGTINSTSAEVVAAAGSTQNIARQMNEASERQAKDITAVTQAINSTSQSLQEVAGRAEQMSAQAANSVNTARNGVSTVGRTIMNMASLREQIQDTAKRIKRLGESSQEIGTIIEFINDIAEQTNTLALNASIQAAMAGDAGRGFAVVADEVQRLAERAGSATRQIESLVKTIQADTNEAIISMERSTANVVAGAKSAEEAGQALSQIESTSQDLSRLIQDISGSARSQSAEATKIAGTMTNIRQIAVQTSGSAQKTSQAIGELNALSDKLRESVSGFKLGDDAIA